MPHPFAPVSWPDSKPRHPHTYGLFLAYDNRASERVLYVVRRTDDDDDDEDDVDVVE